MKRLLNDLELYGADIHGIMERFLGDEELYETCFHIFLEDPYVQRMRESLKDKNYEQAFEHAHALKGVSGNLGLMPLYRDISNLVEKLRTKDYTGLDLCCDSIIEGYHTLRTYKE